MHAMGRWKSDRQIDRPLSNDSQPSTELLELTDNASTGQTPLLANPGVGDVLTEETAAGEVFHEALGLVASEAADGLDLERAVLGGGGLGRSGVVEDGEDALVCVEVGVGLREFRRGGLDAGLAGSELLESDFEAVDGGAVGAGGGVEDDTAVGEGGLAGLGAGLQEGEEVLDEDEVVGVDGFAVDVVVLGLLHPVGQVVQGHEHGRTGLEALLEAGGRGRGGELGPQGLEDAPCDSGVLDTGLGESLEGHAGLDGRLQGGMGLGDGQLGQNLLVCGDDARQESGGGIVLDVDVRVLIGEGCVGGVGNDEILG